MNLNEIQIQMKFKFKIQTHAGGVHFKQRDVMARDCLSSVAQHKVYH